MGNYVARAKEVLEAWNRYVEASGELAVPLNEFLARTLRAVERETLERAAGLIERQLWDAPFKADVAKMIRDVSIQDLQNTQLNGNPSPGRTCTETQEHSEAAPTGPSQSADSSVDGGRVPACEPEPERKASPAPPLSSSKGLDVDRQGHSSYCRYDGLRWDCVCSSSRPSAESVQGAGYTPVGSSAGVMKAGPAPTQTAGNADLIEALKASEARVAELIAAVKTPADTSLTAKVVDAARTILMTYRHQVENSFQYRQLKEAIDALDADVTRPVSDPTKGERS